MPIEEKDKKSQPKYIKLTGIAIQMGVTIYLGSHLGSYLDENYPAGEKTYLIICTLAAIAFSFFVLLKQLKRINNDS